MYTASIKLILSDTISTLSNQTSSATVSSSARSLYPLAQNSVVITSGSFGIGVPNLASTSSALHVAGAAYVRDIFKAASVGIGIDAASALHVNGGAIVSGDVRFAKSLLINQSACIGESASIYGTFYVEDSASFMGIISNTGNASIGGNLSVYGIPDGPPSQFFQPIKGHSASFNTASFTDTIITSASTSSARIETASITTASIGTMILYNTSSAIGNFHMYANARTWGTASFDGTVKVLNGNQSEFYNENNNIQAALDAKSSHFAIRSYNSDEIRFNKYDNSSDTVSMNNFKVYSTDSTFNGNVTVTGDLTVTGALTNATTNRISSNTVQATFEGATVSDVRFAASMVEVDMNVVGTTSSGYAVITFPSNITNGTSPANKTFLTFSQHQSSNPSAGRLLFNHKLDDIGSCTTASVYVRDILGTLTSNVTVVYHIIQYRTSA